MKRQTYHTQWAAQFAIAAELSRRRYTVALTLGSAKTLDIICTAPTGRPFRVEAKGTTSRTFIRTGNKILEMDLEEDLFLIVALVPSDEVPFRFFVLTHEEIRQERLAQPQTKASGDPYVPGHDGLRWAAIQKHEYRWDKLPELPQDGGGEARETQVWLDFAYECDYLSQTRQLELRKGYEEVGRMLGGIIAHPAS